MELAGEKEADPIVHIGLEEEEETMELNPAQLTFSGLLPVKLYKNMKGEQLLFPEKAREIGVNSNGLTRNQVIKRYDCTSLIYMMVG